jgi:hypothetical protein
MSRLTLLKVVQNYLDYVDGFQIDSIFDSEEGTQAASIAEHVFYRLIDKNRDTPSTSYVGSLDASLDPSKPCILTIPQEVNRIHNSNLSYNTATDGGVQWETVQYISPEEFLKVVSISTKPDNTEVMEVNGIPFVILNNRFPMYCTTFDDVTLVFDSYHKDYDTTLQESKTRLIGTQSVVFLKQDDFVIPLPNRMHSGYCDMVINECCEALRGVSKPSVARAANAFQAKMQQSQKRIGNKHEVAKRYGRR